MSERGLSEQDMGLTEKDTRIGEFDPKKYKSYADLPEDQKPNFVELDGGAFVRKSDAEDRQRFEKRADMHVDKINQDLEDKLSLWDQIRGKEPKGKVGAMDVIQETAEEENIHRVENLFRRELLKPFADKYTIIQDAEEDFEGMTKAKLDARMEEVYQEMHRRDPSVDRDKLFRELRDKVLTKANIILDDRIDPWFKGQEARITKIGNIMRRAVGESAV